MKHGRRQRGYMVMVVLVALVAMMIGGVALVRSMDTNQTVAGNMAFRSSTTYSADAAVAQAVTWLETTAGTAGLESSNVAQGYKAAAADENWSDESVWSACTACRSPASGTDAAGNVSYWVIHRMCKNAGGSGASGNFCGLTELATSGGNSQRHDADLFPKATQLTYRITVRVTGPRNTETLLQTFVNL
jgi:Tfp pilus assembly protein PilX